MKNTYASKIAKLIHEEEARTHKSEEQVKIEEESNTPQHLSYFEQAVSKLEGSVDKKQ